MGKITANKEGGVTKKIFTVTNTVFFKSCVASLFRTLKDKQDFNGKIKVENLIGIYQTCMGDEIDIVENDKAT